MPVECPAPTIRCLRWTGCTVCCVAGMARNYSDGKDRLGGRSYGGFGSSGDYGYGARGEYGQSQFGGGGQPPAPETGRQRGSRNPAEDYWNWYFSPKTYKGRTAGEIGDRFVPQDSNRDRQDTAHPMSGPSARPSAGSHGRGPGRFPAGPKGYRRSDERIREEVHESLMRQPDIDAGNVQVSVQDGRVMLEGSVPERPMRYRIEDLVAELAGVREVDNRIRVGQTRP